MADEATQDADNPHDDEERSGTQVSAKPEGPSAMLSVAQRGRLMTEELDEARDLLFRGKRLRKKQPR